MKIPIRVIYFLSVFFFVNSYDLPNYKKWNLDLSQFEKTENSYNPNNECRFQLENVKNDFEYEGESYSVIAVGRNTSSPYTNYFCGRSYSELIDLDYDFVDIQFNTLLLDIAPGNYIYFYLTTSTDYECQRDENGNRPYKDYYFFRFMLYKRINDVGDSFLQLSTQIRVRNNICSENSEDRIESLRQDDYYVLEPLDSYFSNFTRKNLFGLRWNARTSSAYFYYYNNGKLEQSETYQYPSEGKPTKMIFSFYNDISVDHLTEDILQQFWNGSNDNSTDAVNMFGMSSIQITVLSFYDLLFTCIIGGSASIMTPIFIFICCVICCFGFHKQKLSTNAVLDQFEQQEKEEKQKRATMKINQDLFQIQMEEISVKEKIGSGGFATVFLAEYSNMDVAFKVFNTELLGSTEDGDSSFFGNFEAELKLISSLNHKNIPRFYGASLESPRCGLVMEYCPNGDLYDFFEKHNPSIQEKIKLLHGIVQGMSFLASKNIIHRDLKPGNILISESKTAKITDFGLSRTNNSGNKTVKIGTHLYMAPEVFKGEDYGLPADVFSFGIIIHNVLSNNFSPFGKKTSVFQSRMANDKKCRPDYQLINQDIRMKYGWLIRIMENAWNDDPLKRFTFKEIDEKFKQRLKKK